MALRHDLICMRILDPLEEQFLTQVLIPMRDAGATSIGCLTWRRSQLRHAHGQRVKKWSTAQECYVARRGRIYYLVAGSGVRCCRFSKKREKILRLFLSVLLCLGINSMRSVFPGKVWIHSIWHRRSSKSLTQQSSGKPLEPELFQPSGENSEWLEVIDAGQWNFTPAQVCERKIKFQYSMSKVYFRIPSLEVRIDSRNIDGTAGHFA